MPLNLGGIIRLTYAVKNELGADANPTGATLAITQPDGTLAAGIVVDITPDVVGQLVYDFNPPQPGLHSVHWATTGPATAEDDVFVAERPASLLVSVDEAVSHLRAQGQITSDDDREQLQWLCLVASGAVEDDLDLVIARRSITATFDGGGYELKLQGPPRAADGGSVTIATVAENGASVASDGYVLRKRGWRLVRGTATSRWPWAAGIENISVTYAAGCPDPPRAVRAVALNTVQSLWQSSQQAAHPFFDESGLSDQAVTAALTGLPGPLRDAYESLRSVNAA